MKKAFLCVLLFLFTLEVFAHYRRYTFNNPRWRNIKINLSPCSPCPKDVNCFCDAEYTTIAKNKREGTWVLSTAFAATIAGKKCASKICSPDNVMKLIPNDYVGNKEAAY